MPLFQEFLTGARTSWPSGYPLPVVIASLVSDLSVFHNLMITICLIALAPSVILVLLLRRLVVQGLSAGAMKG